jgi:hypothetical protein
MSMQFQLGVEQTSRAHLENIPRFVDIFTFTPRNVTFELGIYEREVSIPSIA